MKKLVKALIYSLAVFIGIFGMGQLNVLADDSQTDESSSESVKDTDSTPQQWGDATWYVKDNVLYLGGTEIPDYFDKPGESASLIPWLYAGDGEKITKIVVEQKLRLPSNSSLLFGGLTGLKEIDGLDKLDISNVTNFYGMFYRDSSLTDLDLSSFQTSKDNLNLKYMFCDDSNLEKVDLSGFTNSNIDTTNMFIDNTKLNQITLSGLILSENSFIDSTSGWLDLSSDKKMDYPQGNGKTTTWNLAVDKDKMSSASLDLALYSNKKITMNSDRLNEPFTTVDMSSSLKNPDSTDKVFVGIDSESGSSKAPTVSKDLFTYVGQTISINAPVVDGYTANPNVLEITLKLDTKGKYRLETNNSDKSFVINIDGDDEEAPYTIYYTKNPEKITPPTTHHTTTPTVTSKFTHKLQTLTTYPDQDSADIYDEDGNLSKTVALSPNSNWQTDEYMTIKGEKYYRVATNEFVKASDIYLYKDKDSVVRTHDGADYISLDNSHGDTVTNRALAVKTDWKIDKVIKINNEDYYRVATNEFVKADNVDVIR